MLHRHRQHVGQIRQTAFLKLLFESNQQTSQIRTRLVSLFQSRRLNALQTKLRQSRRQGSGETRRIANPIEIVELSAVNQDGQPVLTRGVAELRPAPEDDLTTD